MIVRKGRILMLQQAERGEGAEFMLPGGHVEPGELPQQALEREVLEETGLVVTSSELAGVFPKEDKPHDIYVFRVLSCAGRLILNGESLAWGWVDVRDEAEVQKLGVRRRYVDLARQVRGWEAETHWPE
jgi:8-oxo-dGTP pyrophosphatase MutT (NUDIX family)